MRILPDEPACWSWTVPPLRESYDHIKEIFPDRGVLTWDDDGSLRKAHRVLSRTSLATFQFIEYHDGRCAICSQHPAELIVDHDHWCGLVRGYLCKRCNVLEGTNRADERPLITRYRRRHPASILNYFEGYITGGTSQVILAIRHREDACRREHQAALAWFASRITALDQYGSELDEPPRLGRAARRLLQTWSKVELCTRAPHDGRNGTRGDMMATMRDLLTVMEEASQSPRGDTSEELQELISGLHRACAIVHYYERFGMAGTT